MRPTRDQLYMAIATQISWRGTCLRAKVGALIVQEGRIVSTGYNGAPAGQPHCSESSCDVLGSLEGHGCWSSVHAELNAIVFAARQGGISTRGGTLYTTLHPCLTCAKAIINAGIVRVVFAYEYREAAGMTLLQECGIEVDQWSPKREPSGRA